VLFTCAVDMAVFNRHQSRNDQVANIRLDCMRGALDSNTEENHRLELARCQSGSSRASVPRVRPTGIVLIKYIHHPYWSRRRSHGFSWREMKGKTTFDPTEFEVKKLSLTSIFPWGGGTPPGGLPGGIWTFPFDVKKHRRFYKLSYK
jgi:hypothetical protein